MPEAASPLSRAELFARLELGHAARVVVVTPNQRLSQSLQREFDAHRAAQGHSTWESADILPWPAFVGRLWEDALYSDGAEGLPVLLTPEQEQACWEGVVGQSSLSEGLLSATAAARQCRDAWQLAHAWRLVPRLATASASQDTRAFLEWSAHYERLTRERGQVDAARLPEKVVALLHGERVRKPSQLVLYGFDLLTPQQLALLAALSEDGVTCFASRAPACKANVRRVAFTSPQEELQVAARWARARLEADSRVRIGIVVPDLSRSRAAVRRIFDAVMSPGRPLPGTSPGSPFNLSLGLALPEYPLVHDALLLLQLTGRETAFGEASQLLRSPFLAGAETEMSSRARLDAALRDRAGVHLTLDSLVRLVALDGTPRAPVLSERLGQLAQMRRTALSGTKLASDWAHAFSDALKLVGFPGERSLDSTEYQTLQKWHEVLARFATLDRVTGRMSHGDALQRLRRLAGDTLFQPEAQDVPIQVMGILESAGLAFDHLWVCGLTDEAWPLPARPNPFLPVALQREAGIAQADASASLALDRRFTQGWLEAAPEVVLSHARIKQDSEVGPSPLIAALDCSSVEVLGIPQYGELVGQIHAASRLERVLDAQGPAVTTPVLSGGTGVFRDQAACGFRAFARYRLDSTSLSVPQPGLDLADRGTLLHHTLALAWTRLENKAQLDSIDAAALHDLLDACATDAIARVHRYRPEALAGRFAALEKARLVRVCAEWLAFERGRSDFTVVATENKRPVSFGGVTVNVKLDRMDQLAEGGHVILDYKTGKSEIAAWLGPRPDEPQLPMYALGAEVPVAAIAFAQLKVGKPRFKGLANAEGLLPQVGVVSKVRGNFAGAYPDWHALQQGWQQELDALGEGFAAGQAKVDPKYGDKTCQYCDQHLFCRVAELSLETTEDEEGEDE